MNRLVNITKRVKVNGSLRYCPVVRSSNGRIRQDIVLVDGKEGRHTEGSYYLDWLGGSDGRKRFRIAVGKDATLALTAQQQKEHELANGTGNGTGNADNGDDPETSAPDSNPSLILAEAAEKYLAEIKITKKDTTLKAYSKALEYFKESCGDKLVAKIIRSDLINFRGFLVDEKKQSPRSVYNKFAAVVTFLKAQGVRGLVKTNDWPDFVQAQPQIYEQEELDRLFAACSEQERLWFEFFLMTGEREQEVMYTYWTDIDLNHATVQVTHKPDRGWTPKAYKEREIPIPDRLVTRLKAWKATRDDKKCNLVFPTAGCRPKLDFLDCLKRVAKRAKLHGKIKLHKFRSTFATTLLQNGVDLETVRKYLGHSDMESTLRYLKPARNAAVRSKINGIFGGDK